MWGEQLLVSPPGGGTNAQLPFEPPPGGETGTPPEAPGLPITVR